MRPDLPRGRVDLIGGVCDVGDPTSNQTWIRCLQPLHRCSIGYQPRTTWLTSPRRLFLQANRRTQARKCKHAIWNCKYEWSKGKVGVQELDSKGLIDTVEEIKNGSPDSQQKDLSSQLQWRRQFLKGKLDLNKTLTLMWRRLLNI